MLGASGAAIAAAGPAALLSYMLAGTIVFIVMRMLGEMAITHPGVRTFTEFSRAGLGDAAGFGDGCYDIVELVAITGHARDLRAVATQGQGDRSADATRSAGDERNFALK